VGGQLLESAAGSAARLVSMIAPQDTKSNKILSQR
jgi:hypothetical protein